MANSTTPNNKKGILTVAIVMSIIILAGCVALFLLLNNTNSDKSAPEKEEQEMLTLEEPDIEAYFEQNASIVSVSNVAESETVLSNQEAQTLFGDRGFSEELTTMYDIDGNLLEDGTADISSTEVYPMQQTIYVSDAEEMWTISVINGTIVAAPISYNINSDVQILFSETDTIFSYDALSNQYYETIPNGETIVLIKVEHIDAATLNALTVEEIDLLW